MDTKLCRKCGETKPLEDFHKDRKSKDGHCFYCKECNKRKTREHYRDNVDKVAEKERGRRRAKSGEYRDYNYRSKYGITLEDYNRMFEEQGGVCATCGQPESRAATDSLAVDHDHETGKVRGLLCSNCNRSLGLLKENIGTLQNLIAYLQTHSNYVV